MLIKQLINLEKVRTASDNLKFRTHLRDRVMDGWSVTQQMIVYKDKLLKNLQLKIKACPVNAGHYKAFKNRISFATDWAAYFIAINSRFQAFARRHVK